MWVWVMASLSPDNSLLQQKWHFKLFERQREGKGKPLIYYMVLTLLLHPACIATEKPINANLILRSGLVHYFQHLLKRLPGSFSYLLFVSEPCLLQLCPLEIVNSWSVWHCVFQQTIWMWLTVCVHLVFESWKCPSVPMQYVCYHYSQPFHWTKQKTHIWVIACLLMASGVLRLNLTVLLSSHSR